MADDYWIDIVHGHKPRNFVGADDYQIEPTNLVAGPPKHRHHHRGNRGGQYWERPLFYTVDYGEVPVNVSQEDYEVPDSVEGFFGDVLNTVKSVGKTVGKAVTTVTKPVVKVGGDIVHVANSVVKHVPFAGPAIGAALALNPVTLVGGLASNVLAGERIDKAFLGTAKQTLKGIKDVAPYVSQVVSMVPGVGTGVAAAIAAGTAIAEGRTITDAVLSGLSNAVPGGALGKTVFGAVQGIAHGQSIEASTMAAIKSQLPPNVQRAVDTAIAASKGKNVREAILQAIRANVPADVKKALDVSVAVATARNIQSNTVNALVKPATLVALAKRPMPTVPPAVKRQMPVAAPAKAGFNKAVALMQHQGVTPMAIVAAQASLPAAEKEGFTQGLKALVNHYDTNQSSLVRGGLVTRGAWRAVSANSKGAIPGRLIRNGQIINGHFTRV